MAEIPSVLKPFGRGPIRLARALVCLWAIGQLLFSTALAASPSLHKFFHHDSDSPSHECLATVIAQGQMHSSPGPLIVLALPVVFLVLVIFEPLLPQSQRDLRLPAGRAPPLV